MLPKVVVWRGTDRAEIHKYLKVDGNNLIVFEGSEANVHDFRHWINMAMETLEKKPEYLGVIWDANKLSWECQAVLLKPLEETKKTNIFLVTESENLLVETILSRCVVEFVETANTSEGKYWSRVIEAWKGGPAACMTLSENVSQEEALELADEMIVKLRLMVRDVVNVKRLEMLKGGLVLAEEMRAKNLNVKLCLGEFLLKGWKTAARRG